jgi:chromatin remodeling complex protein RSC6
MPKKSSTKNETEPVTTTPVTASVETSTSAPVTDKKVKPSKTPKTTTTPNTTTPNTTTSNTTTSTAPVATPASVAVSESVTPLQVFTDSSSGETEAPLAEQSVEFLAKLQQLSVMISTLKTEYRALEKKWSREVKAAQKVSSKRKRKAGNRAPSGFVKPTKISDELASFLGKDKGTEMARTEVTRDINKYIRNNDLQDKQNGRKINPDSKLSALLKLKKNDELTYFNLQRYMSPHFEKASKVVTA